MEEVKLALTLKSDDAAAMTMKRQIEPKLGPPKEVALDLGNNVTLKLVLIPAGTFMMGSPENEKDRDNDEGPQHEVTISKAFYMGVTEVTQEQYEAVTGRNPSNFKGAKNPVEQVSWDDAVEFCRKLSTKTGNTVRLPTEAQWEYACRAGTKTPFNTGETISTDEANYDGNYTYGTGKKGEYREKTVAVGSFKPNAWGLYDMHGNVWEWCFDAYKRYAEGRAADPKIDGDGKEFRVLRGGSWLNLPRLCRSAHRHWHDPGLRIHDGFGFRVCLDLP
jgi:formylglycine-generating enzyme required for sulfatase activity